MQASVVQIRGRVLAPAPLLPSWWWFRHLIDLGDEEADAGRAVLAAAWYELACSWAPPLTAATQSVFEAFVARAKLADDAEIRARRFRAACAVATTGHT